MCGIAGFLDPSLSIDQACATAVIGRMSSTIVHRGPDDGGTFIDAPAGIALGSRRLAVVDLSPQGRQPMYSACGRYVMVLNGEIYNHRSLRSDLIQAGGRSHFRGHSDTETLLEAAAFWGLPEALRRSVGMFAVALWDTREQTLTLARDRIGEKPLFFGWSDGVFLFASELKALRAHPRWNGKIDREAEALYFQLGYVPGPRSIYAGIGKLPAGAVAELRPGTRAACEPSPACIAEELLCDAGGRVQTRLQPYWLANSIVGPSAARPSLPDAEAVAELDRLLRRTVGRQMLADVPVGLFLSGGIDSSLVTAIAQAESSLPVKTFTIGLVDREYDESENASAVARHLGTDHTSLIVSPRDAMDVIPHLPRIYDEPFADSSQIPTFLVSKLARTKVTVALSGDGGDEMFGGYNRHYWVDAVWKAVRRTPRPLRRLAAGAVLSARPGVWDAVIRKLSILNSSLFHHRVAGDKMHKLARVLDATGPLEMSEFLAVSGWPVANGLKPRFPTYECMSTLDLKEQIMFQDMMTYLPDDIMVKVDRASMAVSLETRAPFLDHEIVEFAWSLPVHQKIRGRTGKWLLRELLYRHVPRQLLDRPKMGFAIPLGAWLRGPLRDWAESLLTPEKLARQHAVDPSLILDYWKQTLSGDRNWTEAIWYVLIYQAWLDEAGTASE